MRALLSSERGLELLEAARSSGEFDPGTDAAICAHMARATLEHRYAPAREATMRLFEREVSVEGDTRSLGTLVGEWSGTHSPAQRDRHAQAMGPELERFAKQLLRWRDESDASVGELLSRLSPVRHADAGPEGGGGDVAQRWLDDTRELTREALAFAQRTHGAEGEGGLDHLWVALGQPFRGLVTREGRFRRLAADWEPIGLRRLLALHARAAGDHPGPLLAPHVVVLAAQKDVRVSAAGRDYGLSSELATAEAIGRVVGLVHGSAAQPFALRFPSVATVARALGSLAVLRLADPRFWRRMRDVTSRESEVVARMACLYYLLESRLAAAAVLSRKLTPSSSLDEAAVFVEQALLGAVPRGAAAALVLRVAPGGPFRAKAHGAALAWALREQFDEDWYLNPRASEPLRGALVRGGALSIEQLTQELGSDLQRGIGKLSELF